MLCRTCPDSFGDRLLQLLSVDHQVLGAQRERDDICRIAPLGRWGDLSFDRLPMIPAKKLVIPPEEILWTLSSGDYVCPSPSPPVALLGVFPCDLAALDYLDRVFAADPLYGRRRASLFLVGVACLPGDDCYCPSATRFPSCDLYLDGGRVWSGSPRGERLLERCPGDLGPAEDRPLPQPKAEGPCWPSAEDLAALFQRSQGHPLWRETARRCLSCGACSAVCPTCYCFDVIDTAAIEGAIVRRRAWDNCFFSEHALVAGGHNFRPGQEERLRFRFEHKFLGFGAQKGEVSCVGCGRCRRHCPVNIDLSEVLRGLVEGEGL